MDHDWTKSITNTDDFKPYEVYKIPKNTFIYRGDNTEWIAFMKGQYYSNSIKWFGTYKNASIYGPVVQYKTVRPLYLLALDSVSNYNLLEKQFNSDILKTLRNVLHYNSKYEKMERNSEPLSDFTLAKYLCDNLFKTLNLDGWAHLSMKEYETTYGIFASEILLSKKDLITSETREICLKHNYHIKKRRWLDNNEKKENIKKCKTKSLSVNSNIIRKLSFS